MAELSERDKRILLGDNFREKEAQPSVSGRAILTPAQKRQRYESFRGTALTIGGLAALIFVTNWLHISGPYNSKLALGTGIVALAGFAIAYFSHTAARSVRS